MMVLHLVLAKMMEVAKEIRPDDKNAGEWPPPGVVVLAVAVRAPGRWSAGGGRLGAIWAAAGGLPWMDGVGQ